MFHDNAPLPSTDVMPLLTSSADDDYHDHPVQAQDLFSPEWARY